MYELGYPCNVVNHTYNLVDPDTGICIQKIESTWIDGL